MKNILIILILVSVAFVSCDGRKSRSESLKISISEFNEKQADAIIVRYYPQDYTEVVTDTLLSNKVKVHIKNYSVINEGLFMSIDETTVPKTQNQHRVFESEVVISTPSKELLNTHISAEQFKSVYPDKFWNHATLEQVWFNQELSSSTDIKLDMSFINPSDNSYKLYRMSIDGEGHQTIDLIEEDS